ncbi:32193_t:CDS:1, partial [Gigaspora margarita]
LLKSDNSTLNIPINNIENALFINNAELSTFTIIPQPTYSPYTTLQPNNSSLALDPTTAAYNVQASNYNPISS